MRTSESHINIDKALIEFQASMKSIVKDAKNPHFRSSYTSLDATIEAIRPILTTYGCDWIQGIRSVDGRDVMVTRIIHASGEWYETDFPMAVTKQDMQGWGSAATYARRYGLQGALGLASADDDANEAVKPAPVVRQEIKKVPLNEPRFDTEEPQLSGLPGALLDNSGEFIVSFGNKYKGKKLSEIGRFNLKNYLDWAKKQEFEGKATNQLKEFIQKATEFLGLDSL